MPSKTAVVKDKRYLRHETSAYHPESPKRLEAIYRMLDASDMSEKFTLIEPRYATHDEIEMIHEDWYISAVANTAGKTHCYLDPDTETSPESYETAKLAIGGFLNAIDAVVNGEAGNAFAFVRPPGHHAEADRAAGFCLFNNIAIGATHAINKHKMEKILIVDWDLHHGNGTQHSFYADPRVVYFSTHQYPYYPGTGSVQETGNGAGKGYTVNVPLQTGPGDNEYVKIFNTILRPLALEFKPDMVLLSAGFDIYFKDPLGGMNVTPKGFACLARVLLDIADACSAGRFIAILEGGYHLEGLTSSCKAVLGEMRGDTYITENELNKMEAEADKRLIDKTLDAVKDQLKPCWKAFR
jgi:acetoin utilization deacetylase AcuC-like enzyme